MWLGAKAPLNLPGIHQAQWVNLQNGEMGATWGVVICLDAWVDHSTVVSLPHEQVT